MYIVISKPKRRSWYCGLVHAIAYLLSKGSGEHDKRHTGDRHCDSLCRRARSTEFARGMPVRRRPARAPGKPRAATALHPGSTAPAHVPPDAKAAATWGARGCVARRVPWRSGAVQPWYRVTPHSPRRRTLCRRFAARAPRDVASLCDGAIAAGNTLYRRNCGSRGLWDAWCTERESNPYAPFRVAAGFKPAASTNSAIRACGVQIIAIALA